MPLTGLSDEARDCITEASLDARRSHSLLKLILHRYVDLIARVALEMESIKVDASEEEKLAKIFFGIAVRKSARS